VAICDEKIHCIGIGGIGVSSVAGICSQLGAKVSGCDLRDNEQTQILRTLGCQCYGQHSIEHLEDISLVVYSSAIKADHPELRHARKLEIPTLTRAQMLARLQQGKKTVAVAGAHGKTTTTWIAANALITAGLLPTVMVGGNVDLPGGNWSVGPGDYFITEVDESDGSLLEFRPTYSIITNVDLEHLDYYRDFDHIRETFSRYIHQTQPNGYVIACADDPELQSLLGDWPGKKISYGISDSADFRARCIRLESDKSIFEVVTGSNSLGEFVLSLPGEHNVQNAVSVVALACQLDIPMEDIRRAFINTTGVGRRLQLQGKSCGVSVWTDYAHHPREIRATLKAARRIANKRLIGIFQPHRYTRTQKLNVEFGGAFDELDHLLLTPIYAASEKPIEGVDSSLIAGEIEKQGMVGCEMASDLGTVAERLLDMVQPGDTVITLGAGDVNMVGPEFLAMLEETNNMRQVTN